MDFAVVPWHGFLVGSGQWACDGRRVSGLWENHEENREEWLVGKWKIGGWGIIIIIIIIIIPMTRNAINGKSRP